MGGRALVASGTSSPRRCSLALMLFVGSALQALNYDSTRGQIPEESRIAYNVSRDDYLAVFQAYGKAV